MIALVRMFVLILGVSLIVIGVLGGAATIVSFFNRKLLFVEGRMMMLAVAGAVELAGVLLVLLSRFGIGLRGPRHDTRSAAEDRQP